MSPRVLCLLALMATAPALATTPIDQSRPLAADGRVSIENLKGRITVRTWDQPQVRITGSLGDGVEKLLIEGGERDLRIQVRYPTTNGSWFGWWGNDGNKSGPTLLEVTVPAGATLDIDSVSADVDVQGVRGAQLSVESVSGDIDVAGARPGEARVSSVSGDLDLALDSANVGAESVSGDVKLQGRLDGRISVESVSGNVEVSAGTVERLDFSSVSGDASLTLALAAGARLSGESVSGNLTLNLPAATSSRVSAESFSGSISSPSGRVIEEEHGPGSRLDTRLGAGSADIRLETFSGDIRLTTR